MPLGVCRRGLVRASPVLHEIQAGRASRDAPAPLSVSRTVNSRASPLIVISTAGPSPLGPKPAALTFAIVIRRSAGCSKTRHTVRAAFRCGLCRPECARRDSKSDIGLMFIARGSPSAVGTSLHEFSAREPTVAAISLSIEPLDRLLCPPTSNGAGDSRLRILIAACVQHHARSGVALRPTLQHIAVADRSTPLAPNGRGRWCTLRHSRQ